MHLTPEGKICLVETKLWRNPEAHRTVVAQVIAYAKDLAAMSFLKFCEAVARIEGDRAIKEFFKLIKRKEPEIDEIKMQQNIQNSLSQGNFLLLIVGDKIFPEVALLTETIQSAPHLNFTIRLVEIGFFASLDQKEDHLIIIPQIVGKTHEQQRAIVKIVYEEKKPEVEVVPVETEKSTLDKETFLKISDPEGRKVFGAILELSDLHGFPIHWGTKGFTINADVNGTHVALCYCYGSEARGGQIIWTSFYDIKHKVKNGETIVKSLRNQLRQTNFFTETKTEMKYQFKQKLTETQIKELTDILTDLANQIETNGTK